MFSKLFSQWAKRGHKPHSRKTRILNCEVLESRRVHAIDVQLVNQTLFLRGDSSSDVVDVRENDLKNQLTVSVNGLQVGAYSSSGIKRIDAVLGAGNDTFNFRQLSNLTRSKEIRVDLGDGNDAANFYGNAHQVRADLIWTVVGGIGNDTAWTDLGGVNDNVNVRATFDLGAGDDRLPFFLRGELRSNSKVVVEALGGNDNDSLAFDAVRNGGVNINSSATLNVNLDGGNGIDQLGFYYQGDLDGTVSASLNGGNGYDYGSFYNNRGPGSQRNVILQQSGIQEWRASGY